VPSKILILNFYLTQITHMLKVYLISFLRKTGLIKIADYIRFIICYIQTYSLRKKFLSENKGVVLPPAYYIYETFGLNYNNFYTNSTDTAKWLISYFEKYVSLENVHILDWGCGPGRVIRHLPAFLPASCSSYGTDYNKKYIQWCTKNIPQVKFKPNNLQPPLAFENNYFDIVYGISIFTHLSLEMHYLWMSELLRVTKPGGILFLTMHGDAAKSKLPEPEKGKFDNGELVVKGNTKEGHRTFVAYQPPSFIKKLVAPNIILEHVPGTIINQKPQQDVWIIRKV
jgi:SAM-dependent methyltransferase